MTRPLAKSPFKGSHLIRLHSQAKCQRIGHCRNMMMEIIRSDSEQPERDGNTYESASFGDALSSSIAVTFAGVSTQETCGSI